jgi:hypothetical protein
VSPPPPPPQAVKAARLVRAKTENRGDESFNEGIEVPEKMALVMLITGEL